jgi:hypothetical protein
MRSYYDSLRSRSAGALSRRRPTPLDPPLPFHVDVAGTVDHDLGHLGVLEQELDGSEPDHDGDVHSLRPAHQRGAAHVRVR